METTVSPGDLYTMNDVRHFHQVATPEKSYSLMIMGKPYFEGATKRFSRNTPSTNLSLTQSEIDDVLQVAR